MSTEGSPPGSWTYAALRCHLTVERLGSYDRAAGGDLEQAFRLYEWNIEAAAAVMTTTAMVEVIVRNAIDAQLRTWSEKRRGGSSWFDVAPLDARGRADLHRARQRATRCGRDQEIHGKVIAELSLGFWRYLAASRYLTSLWIPAVSQAFSCNSKRIGERRVDVERELQRLHYVRNRAAHHEPIHRRYLLADHRSAVAVTSWVSPDCAGWVADRSPIPGLNSRRPV